jgi:DNA repair protein RadD
LNSVTTMSEGRAARARPQSTGASERPPSTEVKTGWQLRGYQADVIGEFTSKVSDSKRRILLVAPTASGKTVIGASIVGEFAARRRNVLLLAHRREIIDQTSKKLTAHHIGHGVIQAGVSPRPLERVQIASIQTLWVRAMRSDAMRLPPADLLVIDEAHHTPAQTYRKIIDAYPDAVLLGLTATPCRGDGHGLGGIFETMIQCPQVAELIQQGFLVKTRVYAPVDPDLRGVKTQGGDFVESQLAERMDKAKLVGDIVTHWHKYGERRKTVAFAVSVGHSMHIRDEFVRSGVRAAHIDGGTPMAERDEILAQLASGKIELVSNCMILTEGWDMPEVGCCILARPTKKMGLYRQMIGRVLRPAPGKADAIVLDHSGAVFRHGFAEDYVEWTLDPERRAESPAHAFRCEEPSSRLLECSQCGAIRIGGKPCLVCGFLPRRPAQYLTTQDGELGLVHSSRRAQSSHADPATRTRWHAMLTAIRIERDRKPGWVAHKYREKFGEWPPWGVTPEPVIPSAEVQAWVRSRDIAFAKSKSRLPTNVMTSVAFLSLTPSSSTMPIGGDPHDLTDVPF